MRTIFLVVVAAGGLVAGAAAAGAAERPRPNILFLFTDDHATQAIGAYGSKLNRTPHMDRLAAEGMLFRSAYVTNSICGPSRAVILTGKHSHLNGFRRNGDKFDGSQVTFPKLLRQAGYQTAIIGKWHLETDPTGFDHWMVLPGQGDYYNPEYLTPGGRKRIEGYSVEVTTDLTLQWLDRQRDKSKPFMVMCQYKAPHRNWMPGPKYLTMYQGQTIPEPATLFDDYSGRGTAARSQEMTIARHMFTAYDLKLPANQAAGEPPRTLQYLDRLTPEQRRVWDAAYAEENEAFAAAKLSGDDLVRWRYQRYIKDYLRCVAAVDDNIGRLLDYLEKAGLAENTIVIYSSDQGFYLGEHGWYDKRFMYEESFRTPLIVRWPGVTKGGSQNAHLVQNLDFAQTFLEMAGVSAPADMQGRSLVPLLRGQRPAEWRESLYYHYYEHPGAHMVHKHCGVRTDRYKLIHFYTLNEWEFYDLEKDPQEMRSAYDDPAYAQVIERMKQELSRLQQQYRVPAEEFR
jgi:arylsulfatase A-like enzyme